MRAYSHGNSTPLINSNVSTVAPVWDGLENKKFSGVCLQLMDGVTVIFLDPQEVKAIKALAYLAND
jgi:alpha-D-ribose 1-methylphosphonate 5-triphosphate synthase subunit PhnH